MFSKSLMGLLLVSCFGSTLESATVSKVDKKANRILLEVSDEELATIAKDQTVELAPDDKLAPTLKGAIAKIGRKQKLVMVLLSPDQVLPKSKQVFSLKVTGTVPSPVAPTGEAEAPAAATEESESATSSTTATTPGAAVVDTAAAAKTVKRGLSLRAGLPVDHLYGLGLSYIARPLAPLSFRFGYSYALSNDVSSVPNSSVATVKSGQFKGELLEFVVQYKFWNALHAFGGLGYRWYGARVNLKSDLLSDEIKATISSRSWVGIGGLGASWQWKKSILLSADLIGISYPITKDSGSKFSASGVFSTTEKQKMQEFYDSYADYLGAKPSDRFMEVSLTYLL